MKQQVASLKSLEEDNRNLIATHSNGAGSSPNLDITISRVVAAELNKYKSQLLEPLHERLRGSETATYQDSEQSSERTASFQVNVPDSEFSGIKQTKYYCPSHALTGATLDCCVIKLPQQKCRVQSHSFQCCKFPDQSLL